MIGPICIFYLITGDVRASLRAPQLILWSSLVNGLVNLPVALEELELETIDPICIQCCIF